MLYFVAKWCVCFWFKHISLRAGRRARMCTTGDRKSANIGSGRVRERSGVVRERSWRRPGGVRGRPKQVQERSGKGPGGFGRLPERSQQAQEHKEASPRRPRTLPERISTAMLARFPLWWAGWGAVLGSKIDQNRSQNDP